MSSNSKTVFGFLIGAAVGVGLGILFAPDKGSATREKIQKGFQERKNQLLESISDLSSSLKEKFGSKKAEIEAAVNSLIEDAKEATPEIISSLEDKLKDLKKAAAKL